MSLELEAALMRAMEAFDAMTCEQKEEMFKKQRDGWVKAEMQWAKDFREGKCRYD